MLVRLYYILMICQPPISNSHFLTIDTLCDNIADNQLKQLI